MNLALNFYRGSVVIFPPVAGKDWPVIIPEMDIRLLTHEISKHLRTLVIPAVVAKPRGYRGFSFHWSNAQRAWDVISANDPSWQTDGAEFLVYFAKDALSPLGKPWSLKEMEYVAKTLPDHPGFANSMESSRMASASRVTAKFLERTRR